MLPSPMLAATVSLSLALAPVAPPPDARIDEALRAFEQAWMKEPRTIEGIRKAAEEATRGLVLEDLTPIQIGRLFSFPHLTTPLGGDEVA